MVLALKRAFSFDYPSNTTYRQYYKS